ncbi:MAG: MFS transporter [Thermoproteota archaeon]
MAGRRLVSVLAAGLPAFAYFYTVGAVSFWLPLYVRDLGWSYTYVQLLSTVFFIMITPSTLVSGLLADITGRPSIVVSVGMLVNAATVALMAHTESPHALLALRALQGIGLAASLPISTGSLSTILGTLRGVSATLLFSGAGMGLGSVAGGLLLEHFGYRTAFYVASAVSAASALAALASSLPAVKQASGALSALRRVPIPVALAVAALVVRNFFASGVFATSSILFREIVGSSPLAIGVALAVNPVVQVAASLAAPRLVKRRELPIYAAGLASTGLVFYAYLKAESPAELVAAQAVLGLVYGFMMVSGNTYIISRSPEEVRYTASSLYSFGFNLGWILGTPVAGAYMDSHSLMAWVELASVGCLASSLLVVPAAVVEGGRRVGGAE